MKTTLFNQQTRFDLAATLAAPLGAVLDRAQLTITADESLAVLIEQIAQGKPTILPVCEEEHDTWFVMGAVRRDLEATLSTIGHFVIPTYAEFASGAPSCQHFDPIQGEMSRLGALVYPSGYYLLRSPKQYFERMLNRLGRWAVLEQRRPKLQIIHSPSYRELYDNFSASLSAGMWNTATEQLTEIRQRGLTTTENLAFLEVQLLAQQHRWSELWNREDYRDIARLRVPRAVQNALLAAFHQSELLPLEQSGRWFDALAIFRQLRARLGSLIEGIPDTKHGPALRIFAYREAITGDRSALVQLAERATDKETRLVIEALLNLLPADVSALDQVIEKPSLTPKQALRSALMDGLYDEAWQIAEQLDDPESRTKGMLEAAFYSEDLTHTEKALLQFWSLPQDQQDSLREIRRYGQIIKAAIDLIEPEKPVTPDEILINDWSTWLSAAVENPNDNRLSHMLTVLSKVDAHYWTDDRIVLLAEQLINLVSSHDLMRPHFREAIRCLRNIFIQDPEFPHDDAAHTDVYEALYLATLEQREVNQVTTLALLRLAEARLRKSPALRTSITDHLKNWFRDPTPVLGDTFLEAIDLLAAYGEQGPALGTWLRSWLELILFTPRNVGRTVLESWNLFADWSQPGNDLLNELQNRIAVFDATEDDPIAQLPNGYMIGIFTLRPESVDRVSTLINRRNPGIEIRLCNDTVLTSQARSLAQNADMCVVVTTCITHALSYGIKPYLPEPVYPQSSGSTSILQAIEKRALSVSIM